MPPARQRNDPRQYDDLAAEWWRPRGAFAPLHWLAAARAGALPPAAAPGAVLLDLACGGGLLAPHVTPLGYRHVGVDLSLESLRLARAHGVSAVRADVRALPVRDAAAAVVVAGEVLEHVPGLEPLVAEVCRVLAPGGTLLLDTLADTWLARFLLVTVGERLPAVPRGIHDPALFVNRDRLRRAAAAHGVPLDLTGLRPRVTDCLSWLVRRRPDVRMVPTRPTTVLFTGHGRKEER
ncbi:MAG: methyltransferase domain-containing protein [Mycobacteriales bacterium]